MVEIPPICRLLCRYESTECHLPEHCTVEVNWPCRIFQSLHVLVAGKLEKRYTQLNVS